MPGLVPKGSYWFLDGRVVAQCPLPSKVISCGSDAVPHGLRLYAPAAATRRGLPLLLLLLP